MPEPGNDIAPLMPSEPETGSVGQSEPSDAPLTRNDFDEAMAMLKAEILEAISRIGEP